MIYSSIGRVIIYLFWVRIPTYLMKDKNNMIKDKDEQLISKFKLLWQLCIKKYSTYRFSIYSKFKVQYTYKMKILFILTLIKDFFLGVLYGLKWYLELRVVGWYLRAELIDHWDPRHTDYTTLRNYDPETTPQEEIWKFEQKEKIRLYRAKLVVKWYLIHIMKTHRNDQLDRRVVWVYYIILFIFTCFATAYAMLFIVKYTFVANFGFEQHFNFFVPKIIWFCNKIVCWWSKHKIIYSIIFIIDFEICFWFRCLDTQFYDDYLHEPLPISEEEEAYIKNRGYIKWPD